MKRHTFPIVIAITITLLAIPYTVKAAVVTNVSTNISLSVFVPCADGGNGEVVDLEGPLHSLFTVTFDRTGRVHVKMLDQPQGITGTGETTGDTYHATGGTGSQFSAIVGQTFTFVNNFVIIGPKTGNNLLVHETVHVTVNANGTVTANFDQISVDCK